MQQRSGKFQTRTRVFWILALLEMLLASEIPHCPGLPPATGFASLSFFTIPLFSTSNEDKN